MSQGGLLPLCLAPETCLRPCFVLCDRLLSSNLAYYACVTSHSLTTKGFISTLCFLRFFWVFGLLASKEHADSGVYISEGPANTFGCSCRVDESNTLIDNSEAGELVHNNSQWHPGFSALGSVPGVLPTGTIPPVPQTAVPAVAGTPVDQDLEIGEEDEDEADEEMDDIASLNDASDADSLDVPALEPTFPNQLSYTLDAAEVEQLLPDENSALEDGDFDLPDLEEVPEADQINQQTSQGNEKLKHDLFGLLTLVFAAAGENLKSPIHGFKKDINRFSDTTHAKTCPSFVDLPFNLLQTDERDIHLFRDIRFDADLKRRPLDSSHSQVLCQQALNQRMPPGFNYLSQMERLNMIAQIPELGVVVIGNQVGRVGILTMTRWEAQKQSGYKIECILPFSSEEAKGMRPRRPLMGMAVGPIQGQESALPHESPRMGTQPPRRFRLLMTYCDHTILSYEITRPDGEENITVI